MSTDSLRAVARLIPYLGLEALTELIRLGGLTSAQDVSRLAERPHLSAESAIWQPAIATAVTGPSSLTILAEGASALLAPVVAQVAEAAVAELEDVITAPADRVEGDAVAVSWDGDESILVATLSGENLSLAVPPELEAAAEEMSSTTPTTIAAHRRSDDGWLAERIGDVTHGSTVEVPPEVRHAAWQLLEATEENLRDAPGDSFVSVAEFDFDRGGDPDRALSLVSRTLRMRTLTDPEAAARRVLDADALQAASAERRALVLGAIISLPAATLREVGPELGKALASVVPELSHADGDTLAEDVRQGRARIHKAAFVRGVQSAFPTDRRERDRIVETLVVPLDRARAARLIVASIEERLEVLGGELEDEQRRIVQRRLRENLERLVEIASRSQQMSATVRRLPIRADWSWYAGDLLVLRERVGLRDRLPDDFLAAACRFSSRALNAAISLVGTDTTAAQRDAVLAGVGSALDRGEEIPASAQRLLRRLESGMPRVEQGARIAALVGVRAADLFDDDIPARLREGARVAFANDPAEAARKISLLAPWKKDRDHRRLVCETLTSLLRETKDRTQLTAAVSAALSFFTRRQDVNGVGLEPLRAAGWDATRRVTRSGRRKLDPETLELLRRANEILGWSGGSKKPPKAYRRVTE